MELKKASRKQVKLRLNISAPSGAGKTYSALRMAKGLVGNWEKIAVIDTENGSASLYSHLGEFNTIDITAPFTPEKYIEAIDVCLAAGMEAIIMDSTTHEWTTLLEENETLAQAKFRGNTWSAWSQTTPRHDRFVNKVLQCPAHVITCTRSKTETVMGEDKKVKKVGMKDQQREGWEYELTVSLNIDRDTHLAMPSKDRTNLFEGKNPFLITEEIGEQIKEWCESGVAEKPAADKLREATTLAELANVYKSLPRHEQEANVKLKDELKARLTPAQTTPAVPLYMADKDYKAFLTRLKKSGEPEYTKAKEFSDFTAEQETEIANILAGMKSAA
ncbi:MAG: AAA family ATPase [Chryseobacterium sp.]|nr:MAG: AAA family ATPase [Chryseobacterium sp.]